MSTFVSALRNGAKILERRDDDGFDRLSNRYSVAIVVMFAAFISTKSYVGDPIDCYTPKEFSSQWTRYADNYCWIKNTYYVPFDDAITAGKVTENGETSYVQELTYYQWVPIILAFCAFTFAIPSLIWGWASNSGGYDVEAMVKATKGTSNLDPEKRDKTVKYLVNQMDRLLGYRRPLKRKGFMATARPRVGKRYGHFLFIMYLLVKVLYIINAIGLLYILETMLGGNYSYYGIEVWRAMQDENFRGSERFPYVTMCDFTIRKLGQQRHTYTVQCVLPVNLFNEKVFICLWFWLVFVAAASILGLILWLFTASSAVNRTFTRKYLSIMGRVNRNDPDDLVEEFISDYLRLDGVFAMRLILKNTNDAVGGEIMAALWDNYCSNRKPHFDPTTDDLLPRRMADEAV